MKAHIINFVRIYTKTEGVCTSNEMHANLEISGIRNLNSQNCNRGELPL